MRILLYVMLGFMMIEQVAAGQTPVEKVVLEFDDVDGAKDFIAKGAPVAYDCEEFSRTGSI